MRRKKKPRILENFRLEEFANEGRSLGRRDGKVIFVERTVPGDLVDVFLSKNKKDWAEGYPIVFHELSEQRVKPFCSHFGDCGGCQWQSVTYATQLQFKQQQVSDALQRIAKIPLPELLPILGAPEDRYYRNKLEFTFGKFPYIPAHLYSSNKNIDSSKNRQENLLHSETITPPSGGWGVPEGQTPPSGGWGVRGAAGFHARGFFDKIVDIHTCYLQAEPSNAVREAIRVYAEENDLSYYDLRQHKGFLRNLQLRVCTTGEAMANIIVGEPDEEKIFALLRYLQQQVPAITTWVYTINEKKNDSLYDLSPITFSGNGYVVEKLEDFQFKIGPKSFFQTNTRQAERLYQVTREFAALTGKEIVYDLYCGTGSIGIFVSRQAKKIIGVEMIAAAIEDAKENAKLNKLESSEFYAGDVIDICNDEFFAEHGRPDVVITDPPRAGMHPKLVQKILEIEAPTVVYVSCNPATQARDLNALGEKYEITKVQPVDMFPHTHHIECVVQLKLKEVVSI